MAPALRRGTVMRRSAGARRARRAAPPAERRCGKRWMNLANPLAAADPRREQRQHSDFHDVLGPPAEGMWADSMPTRTKGVGTAHDIGDIMNREQQEAQANLSLPDIAIDKWDSSVRNLLGEEKDVRRALASAAEEACRQLRLPPGGSFLDVGCGIGDTVFYAAQCGAGRCFGIDMSEQSILAAQRKAAELRLGEQCRFATGKFPVSTGLCPMRAWDGLLNVDVLQFQGGAGRPRDALQFLTACAQAVVPGGRVASVTSFYREHQDSRRWLQAEKGSSAEAVAEEQVSPEETMGPEQLGTVTRKQTFHKFLPLLLPAQKWAELHAEAGLIVDTVGTIKYDARYDTLYDTLGAAPPPLDAAADSPEEFGDALLIVARCPEPRRPARVPVAPPPPPTSPGLAPDLSRLTPDARPLRPVPGVPRSRYCEAVEARKAADAPWGPGEGDGAGAPAGA